MINVNTRLTSFRIGSALGVRRQLNETKKRKCLNEEFVFTLTLFDLDIHYELRRFR
jgi:hypothetical protein